MASVTEHENVQLGNLPQYGFGTDCSFDSLVLHNHFLFRVHTPKPLGPCPDVAAPFFIGGKFKDDALPEYSPASVIQPSYDDVAKYLDWTTRSASPFISASFSFAWAVWEAVRRYKVNIKHDVQIAVIDARGFAGRAVTAVELLQKGSPKERAKDHWKWYRFATEAQDVLIFGHIPADTILASIPITSIISKMPSYFLHSEPVDADKGSPLARLVWNSGKPSHRQFCQEVSERFLRLPVERRVLDSALGSVRLALCFLRPWFAAKAAEDIQGATEIVCELAFAIAQWPGQWWVRNHPEIWDLVRMAVRIVAEEVCDVQKEMPSGEMERLRGVIVDLEGLTERDSLRRSTDIGDARHRLSRLSESEQTAIGYPEDDVEQHKDPHVEEMESPCIPSDVDETASRPAPPAPQLEAAPLPTSEPQDARKDAGALPVLPRSSTSAIVIANLLFSVFVTLVILSGRQRRYVLLSYT